ncbi:MAG: TIGR03809 family protein [Bradyrhizobium sp.]
MTHRMDAARSRDLFARWCALAERRLQHLTELFESGRWRRYYNERSLLENIREAKTAVETWRELSRDPTAGREDAVVSRRFRDVEAVRPGAGSLVDSPVADARFVPVGDVPSTPVDLVTLERTLAEMLAPALDVGTIERRYPLLRNAL